MSNHRKEYNKALTQLKRIHGEDKYIHSSLVYAKMRDNQRPNRSFKESECWKLIPSKSSFCGGYF